MGAGSATVVMVFKSSLDPLVLAQETQQPELLKQEHQPGDQQAQLGDK